MADLEDKAQLDARTLADLSALADGTLDPERAAAVRRLIARSPELSRRYERERLAVATLHATREDRAPARLRIRIDARRQPAGPPRRIAYGGALAGALAAALAAVILLLPGAAPGAPSIGQAAALSLRGAALPPPTPDRVHPGAKLRQDVQEVYFPNWAGFGWHAAGQRTDHLGRRVAVTVYYQREGRRIAYTILAAPALRRPGTQVRHLGGVELQTFTSDGRVVVTWRRAEHTCVLSGSGVSAGVLLRLAAWKAPGLSA